MPQWLNRLALLFHPSSFIADSFSAFQWCNDSNDSMTQWFDGSIAWALPHPFISRITIHPSTRSARGDARNPNLRSSRRHAGNLLAGIQAGRGASLGSHGFPLEDCGNDEPEIRAPWQDFRV
jgi:hypothetical protein